MRLKIKLLSVFVVLIIISNSCLEKLFESETCDDCDSYNPDYSNVEIKLTINYKYHEIPVIIYKGNIEDKEIIFSDTINYTPFIYEAPANERISVKAEYKWNEVKIFAIDGTILKMRQIEDCEYECWGVDNDVLDVRLKSEFP